MGNGKKHQAQDLSLSDSIYMVMRENKTAMSIDELRSGQLASRQIKLSEVLKVDETLASDSRFSRWGTSNYWKLNEWKDFDGNFYPFLRDKAREVLNDASRPVHYEFLVRRLRDAGIDVNAERLKDALDNAKGINSNQGMYWAGRKDRFPAVTVTDAVNRCVSRSRHLMTLDEVTDCVARTIPGREVKKKTVSGILSARPEFKSVHGAFWALTEWEDKKVYGMLEGTGRRGFSHVISESEFKNGKLRVTAEYLPFMPEEEDRIIIAPSRSGMQKPCRYRPGSGYISGLGSLYRDKGLAPGDPVRFSVRDIEEKLYLVEMEAEGRWAGRTFRGRYSRPFRVWGRSVFDARLDPEVIQTVVEKGSKGVESVILVAPFFAGNIVMPAIESLRPVLLYTPYPLDAFLARTVSSLPDIVRFREEADRVIESTRGRTNALFELEGKCSTCGTNLVARSIRFGSLRARVECTSCGEKEIFTYKLTPGDLERLNRLEEKHIKGWHPDELAGGGRLGDFFTRRSIHAHSILFEKIKTVKYPDVRDALFWCFIESVGGMRAAYERFRYLPYMEERNPASLFDNEVDEMEQRLPGSKKGLHYFFKPGSTDEVSAGEATFAHERELDSIPPDSVDVAIATLPSGRLKPLPDYERVLTAWLAGYGEPGDGLDMSDLEEYFRGVRRGIRPGGRMNLLVEDVQVAAVFMEVEPLLNSLGFKRIGSLPDTGTDEKDKTDRMLSRDPQALVYEKASSG